MLHFPAQPRPAAAILADLARVRAELLPLAADAENLHIGFAIEDIVALQDDIANAICSGELR